MIKFFRKIRQKLLAESKISKYLLYAIGEILLVVIGILIALQINNWNESQKTKKLELTVLKDLRSEFLRNQKVFDSYMNRKKGLQTDWAHFLEALAEKKELNAIRPNHGSQPLNLSSNVLGSILNSGKVDIVENDSLKYLLSNWSQDIAHFRGIEGRHLLFVENDLRAYENPRKFSKSWNYGGEDRPNPLSKLYTDDEINAMRIKINSELAFHNLLMNNYMWINLTLQSGAQLGEDFELILDLIDQEIKRIEK